MKSIILIGGIGNSKSFVGGEHSKNMHLLSALRNRGRTVIPADLADLRKYPWKAIRAILILLFHPRANVIVSSSLRRSGWLIKLFCLAKSKRNICFVGTGREFSKTIADRRFSPDYFRFVCSIIVQGDVMKKELESVGLDAIVLNNFKQIKYLPDLSKKQVINVIRFAFLSRMRQEKGVDLIIYCAKKLNEEGYRERFRIDFYGAFEDSTYEKQITDTISQMNNVYYCGVLDLRNEQGYDILANHVAMLFPTFWPGEGFPGIVIDSLVSGLPIIASDWHFNRDFIEDGKTGVIIPSQDKDSLYAAMVDVIEYPQKYLSMSEYCQHAAKKYDIDNVINEEFLTRIHM